jgi:osmotically-inducible protein OsmY
MLTTLAGIDSALELAIHGRLTTEAGAALRDLGVIAIEGRIRLCGAASSYEQKKRAAEVAAAIDGVRQVINQIRVTPD